MALHPWCVAVGAAFIALAGCTCAPLIGAAPFRCETNDACADNYVCRQGTCLRLGTFVEDGGYPTRPTTPKGTFQLASTGAGSGRSLTVADLDGDGVLDAVMVDDGAVVALKGRGDRTYGAELVRLQPPQDLNVNVLVVADFDSDGRSDLAFTCFYRNSVFVAQNLGGAAFATIAEYELPTSNTNITALVSADFTNDGHTDLLAYVINESKLYVLPSRADGSFGRVISAASSLPNANGGQRAQSIDVNRDGFVDLVVTGGSQSNSVEIVYGKGDGTFQNGRRAFVSCSPSSIRAGEFVGDDQPEFLVACMGTGLGLYRLDAAMLTAISMVTLPNNLSSNLQETALPADLNGDGRLDLVMADGTVVLNSPTGFTEPRVSKLSLSYDYDTRYMAVGDADGDGTADLLMLSKGPFIKVAAGSGTGGLGAIRSSRYGRLAVSTTSQVNPLRSAAADFTGD
ncbi:MAG: VCBS repeat-containing protein, partial [Archangium sp.]|nr:VCBS repeat-containing protein [Archangium sp.]